MTETTSTMLPLGTDAPDFSLKDVTSGRENSLDTFKGKKALLVMFICRHCPYVKNIQREIAKIGRDYQDKGLGIVAISANDPEAYPEDAPESLKAQAAELGFTFPYCFDETQEVAKAYSAVCTPDFFLFDNRGKLVYRGQADDSRPGNGIAPTAKDLRAAIDATLEGKKVDVGQKPSVGCSIKWKPGSSPAYFGH